eukprot:scaffold185602_cov29-Prasinocladus_malaysianus.AAC.1
MPRASLSLRTNETRPSHNTRDKQEGRTVPGERLALLYNALKLSSGAIASNLGGIDAAAALSAKWGGTSFHCPARHKCTTRDHNQTLRTPRETISADAH